MAGLKGIWLSFLFCLLSQCVLSLQANAQFDCDFESGLCGWTQDVNDSINWTLLSGPTGSVGTGPYSDHTTGSGQYAYIESSTTVLGDIARLTSPYNQVVAGGTKCLRFYYHMYGATMGTFNVYVSKVTDPLSSPLFQMTGTQGDGWNLGQVDITRADADSFVVTIEGVVGSSYTSDMAVDDVIIFSGFCVIQCDFEDPAICGYTQQTAGDDFDWLRQSGSTSSLSTGPTTDHTLGTGAGFYMFIESSTPRVQGDLAHLWSPTYQVAGGHCIEFFYHMYGSSIGTLSVYIVETGEDITQLQPSWSESAEQGNQWYIARFLAPTTNDYQIVFEGVIGTSFTSDIAIDDVRIGSCLSQGDYSTDYPTSTLRPTTNEQDYTTRQTQTEEPSTGDYSTDYPTSTLQTTTNKQDYTTRQTQTEEPSTETDLICDSTSMTLIMDRSLLEIGDDARDVHFEDEECVGYNHDSQHVAITTSYDRCGTKQEQDENYMIFSNLVTYYNPRPANGTNQLITREHYLHIPVTCYLEREQVLGDSFIPQIGIYYGKEEGYGEFSLSLQRYTDSSFYRVANDSGKVVLGTPLYFGIGLTSVTNLTLLTESCWATSSPHPLDDQRYDIIANGCAVDSTTYIYNSYVPTFKGFRVDAFTFIGDYDQVYVHCSILICDNSDSSSRCAQGCLTRSRRSLQPTGSRSKPHTITDGPLSDASHFQQAMMLDNGNGGDETSDPLVIAALSALCVLIALTAIMSLVIVRMRRQRPNLIGYRQVGGTEENY